jgi:peptidoglycan hydrolase-like protein with peptidoglycan-binding domain
MKKVIRLTESDLKKIIKKVISEQHDEEEYETVTSVQKFLNNRYKKDKTFIPLKVDGKTGPNSKTAEAIKKYQREKRFLDIDGVLGHETMGEMRKDGLDKFESKFLGLF